VGSIVTILNNIEGGCCTMDDDQDEWYLQYLFYYPPSPALSCFLLLLLLGSKISKFHIHISKTGRDWKSWGGREREGERRREKERERERDWAEMTNFPGSHILLIISYPISGASLSIFPTFRMVGETGEGRHCCSGWNGRWTGRMREMRRT
jgi:hypothetical protein